MNRVQLASKLQNHFNNSVYYTTQDLNESIQDGIDEVVAFTGCRLATALLPFQQYVSYYDLVSLVPDYIGVISIFNKVTNRWLIPSSLKKFELDRPDWDAAYGTPAFFSPINFRYIAIYKKPSVVGYGNFLMFYRAAAPTLSDALPIPIPEEHITVLETYCLGDLSEQAQEWQKAGLQFKSYQKSLDTLRTLIQNQTNRDRVFSLKG